MRNLLAVALFSAACVRVEADLPPVCGDVSVSFPAAAAPMTALSVPMEQTFAFGSGLDLSPVAALRIDSGALQADSGDLSFVQAAQLSVVPPPGTSLPELTLLDWQAPASGTVTHIELSQASPDLTPYFGKDGLVLRVRATGALPAHGWSLLVSVCASGAVDKSWSF